MLVRPPRPSAFVRDLRQEARRKVAREMAQVRFDAGILQPPRTVGGSVVFQARVARTGPLTYVAPSGAPHVETRDADELRHMVSQLAGLPITLEHPAGMDPAPSEVVGKVLTATFEPGDPAFAVCDLQIDDPDALDAIKSGTSQISLGYQTNLDGNRQTGSIVHHVSVVQHARCGGACSMRTDCGSSPGCRCSSCLDRHVLFAPRKEPNMTRPKIDPDLDLQAATDRAARRDLSATFRRGESIAPPSDKTLADYDAPAETDEDLRSMDRALYRQFMRNQ